MEKTVYVLGELNVDLIIAGKDITPELNREKLVDAFDMVLGSSSAITACVLAGLGLDVQFVGIIGDDVFGHFCLQELRNKGVNVEHVVVSKQQKTGITLSMSTAKDRALLTYMGSIPELRPEIFPRDLLIRADHIHFGSYFLQERMRLHWEDVFCKAKACGVQTSFDAGWDPHENWHRADISKLLEVADWFMPSEDEFIRIFGPANDLERALHCLPKLRGSVAVKRGAQGALLVRPSGVRISAKARQVSPVDTTGAGDSFNAGLIYASLAGMPDERLLQFACACGTLATLRIGGAGSVPSLSEVERFLA